MPANAIVLGPPSISNFAKGPHYGLAALGLLWITLDKRDTDSPRISEALDRVS
jgi:hypothetical protein